jgi:hypothetical protein
MLLLLAASVMHWFLQSSRKLAAAVHPNQSSAVSQFAMDQSLSLSHTSIVESAINDQAGNVPIVPLSPLSANHQKGVAMKYGIQQN